MLHRIAVKGVVLSLMAWSLVLPVTAQEVPKIDIFAGYSFLRSQTGGPTFSFANPFSGNPPQKLQPMDGFNASVTENINKWGGITEDLSGYYSDAGIKNHTLLVGPQFSFRQTHGITPFIHAMFGANYQTPARQVITDKIILFPPTPFPGSGNVVSTSIFPFSSPSPLRGSHTAFAMAFGGGVDYNVNPRLSIRLIQADYFRSSFKFTEQVVDQFCDQSGNCSTGPVFNSPTEKHNNLRLSFGVVFHL